MSLITKKCFLPGGNRIFGIDLLVITAKLKNTMLNLSDFWNRQKQASGKDSDHIIVIYRVENRGIGERILWLACSGTEICPLKLASTAKLLSYITCRSYLLLTFSGAIILGNIAKILMNLKLQRGKPISSPMCCPRGLVTPKKKFAAQLAGGRSEIGPRPFLTDTPYMKMAYLCFKYSHVGYLNRGFRWRWVVSKRWFWSSTICSQNNPHI